MNPLRWQYVFQSRWYQRLTATLLLVVCVAALLPIRLYSIGSTHFKDRSRPFPCQDRPCGCRSAEHCKKKCCCFTSEQKLAWADRHGIPASDVVVSDVHKRPERAPNKSCCDVRRMAESTTALGKQSKDVATSRSKVVIGIAAQQCQGLTHWLSGQVVFLTPHLVLFSSCSQSNGERLLLKNLQFDWLADDPPVPPPRLWVD